jgi:hypothetical protein
MRNPLMKKKSVTPNPAGTTRPRPTWAPTTIRIETARRPSRVGMYWLDARRRDGASGSWPLSLPGPWLWPVFGSAASGGAAAGVAVADEPGLADRRDLVAIG